MTATASASVSPYWKTSAISGWARANSAQAAGTTAAAVVRSPYDTSCRTAAVSPSAAAALIRGSSAVISDTVMIPCGTAHSR